MDCGVALRRPAISNGGMGAGGRGGATPRPASINHVCMNMEGFNPDNVLTTLASYGISQRENAQGPVGPLKSYVSLRMENRGGADIAVKYRVPVILMHIKGTPKDMQTNPVYNDVIEEVMEFFNDRINYAMAKGILREKIIIEDYYGISGTPRTLEDIGLDFNLTKERVRQIKEKALRKLRNECLDLFDYF